MIKNDVLRYFSHGDEIKNQLKDGYSYFETGRNNFTKYLYPRLIALYYLVFDNNLYENPNTKKLKQGHIQIFYIFKFYFII